MLSSRDECAQATVELAVSVLFLTVLMFLLLQVGLVARDQVLVTQAAREGARAAAVDPSPGAAAAAAAKATGLPPGELTTDVGARPDPGGMVKVTVAYASKVVMPGADRVLLRPGLKASAAMRVEKVGL